MFLGYHRHKGNQVPWQLVKTVPVVVGIHRSRLIGVVITIASFRVTSKRVKCNGFHYFQGKSADAPEIGILRQFTFSSSLQRMSVIVKNLSKSNFELYAKGSPEMISTLCKEETIPSDFASVLANYTQSGYRVIAVAARELTQSYAKLQKVDR